MCETSRKQGAFAHFKYGIPYSLLTFQENGFSCLRDFDVVLYIGSVSAASFSLGKEYWRINPDGEIRDPYRKTTKVEVANGWYKDGRCIWS